MVSGRLSSSRKAMKPGYFRKGARMVDIDERFEGGCYCGAVRYEIVGHPSWSGHCHCRSCQLALGGAFVTWAKVAADAFDVTKGDIKICEKSPGIKRGFCGSCGTTLTYAAEHDVDGQDWSADAWFSAATLDDPFPSRLRGSKS